MFQGSQAGCKSLIGYGGLEFLIHAAYVLDKAEVSFGEMMRCFIGEVVGSELDRES